MHRRPLFRLYIVTRIPQNRNCSTDYSVRHSTYLARRKKHARTPLLNCPSRFFRDFIPLQMTPIIQFTPPPCLRYFNPPLHPVFRSGERERKSGWIDLENSGRESRQRGWKWRKVMEKWENGRKRGRMDCCAKTTLTL